MTQITRGTTPRVEVEVDIDLTDYTSYLSIGKVGEEMMTVQTTECDVTEDGKSILKFDLTQEDTLKLVKGTQKMQVRAIKNDEAIATDIIGITVADVIKNGVIEDVD